MVTIPTLVQQEKFKKMSQSKALAADLTNDHKCFEILLLEVEIFLHILIY